MTFENFAKDIYFAARSHRRRPGFPVMAVLILGLGIGATTAVFSLVNAVVLRSLPFIEPDRVVILWSDISRIGGSARSETTLPSYVAWKERAISFEDMAALLPVTYSLTGDGEPARLEGTRATANFFSLLGLQPILGRTFTGDDEGLQASPVAVISQDLWVGRFGAEPNIIGSSIILDGLSHTVIGVVPSDFRFPNADVSVWVPAAFSPEELARSNFSHHVIARLNRGITLGEAQAEMTTIASSLNDEIGGPELGVTVGQLHPELARNIRPVLVMLLAAVGAVLLITCANVANLLLTRSTNRRRELALRKALGATDGRVLRQLLTESAVLACVGAAVGVVLATLSFDYLAHFIPGNYPEGSAPTLDWRVFSFAGGVAILTVLLFGVGPALAASRLDLNSTLKKGAGSVGAARRGTRLRHTLVVGEIAVTAGLLVVAGLLLRSYAAVLTVDPGFATENILIAETSLSPSQYTDEPGSAARFSERVLERVNALPGVVSADYANVAPLMGGGRTVITIEGRPPPPPEEGYRMVVSKRAVSPGYLSTLGVPLIQGRYLDERDTADAPFSVVINEAMASVHWPDEDPLGAQFMIGPPGDPLFTVVGVVGDIHQAGLDVPPEPEMYTAFAQSLRFASDWPRHLLVRTQSDPRALAASVRNAVWEVDANQPVSIFGTMRDVHAAELADRDMQLTLVGIFAIAALILASVGLYGVLSYTIAQRTSELGLRMALGAHRRTVVNAVLRSALFLAVLGIVVGLVAALALGRLLATFLFGVQTADPATFAAVSALMLFVAMLASYLPARRAANVDPIRALRVE